MFYIPSSLCRHTSKPRLIAEKEGFDCISSSMQTWDRSSAACTGLNVSLKVSTCLIKLAKLKSHNRWMIFFATYSWVTDGVKCKERIVIVKYIIGTYISLQYRPVSCRSTQTYNSFYSKKAMNSQTKVKRQWILGIICEDSNYSVAFVSQAVAYCWSLPFYSCS